MVERLSPGDVIGRAFGIYRDQIGVLLPAALIVFAIDAIVTWIFDEGALTLIAAVVSLVLATLYQGMVVQLVRDVQDGRRDNTMGELFSSVTPVLGPLILVSILAGIGIGIGFILLIVPGLIFLTYAAASAPVMKLEHRGVSDSIRRSIGLVRGRARKVFLIVVGTILVTEAAVQLIAIPFNGAALLAGVNLVGEAIFQPFEGLVVALVAIHLLELHGEAPAPDAMARALVAEHD